MDGMDGVDKRGAADAIVGAGVGRPANVIEVSAPPPGIAAEMIPFPTENSALLLDESRLKGDAEFLARPRSTDETAAIMRRAAEKKLPVTISGGRTGIVGGAVPNGGLLLSLTGINHIGTVETDAAGNPHIRCGAGVTLRELRGVIAKKTPGLFFPPDPTEDTASVGGIIACDASGAHSFAYGSTRGHVKSVTAVLADGGIIKLERGGAAATDGEFIIRYEDGHEVRGTVPSYPQPPTKNVAGYHSGRDMDLIDLLIGSEGTLAVITEAELYLSPKPEREFAATLFFEDEESALNAVESLKRVNTPTITAIEYFDANALALLRQRRIELGPASGIPPGLPESPGAHALYIDAASAVDHLETAVESILATTKPTANWAAFDRDERDRLRGFRHALPETVNGIIADRQRQYPGLTKLGTDMAVPEGCLKEIIDFQKRLLRESGLEFLVFGHIGDNHPHINLLPRSLDEYDKGKRLYAELAAKTIEMGGSIAAEHGIGKLKIHFLAMMLGPEGMREIRRLKQAIDPDNRLGRGNLLATGDDDHAPTVCRSSSKRLDRRQAAVEPLEEGTAGKVDDDAASEQSMLKSAFIASLAAFGFCALPLPLILDFLTKDLPRLSPLKLSLMLGSMPPLSIAAILFYIRRKAPETPWRRAFNMEIFHSKWVVSALALELPLLLGVGGISIITMWLFKLIGLKWEEGIVVQLAKNTGAGGFAVIAVCAVLLAPVAEEIIFRRVMHDYFKSIIGGKGSFWLTSAIFAIVHFSLSQLAALLFLGAVFQKRRGDTKSLYPAILQHAIHNGATMILLTLIRYGIINSDA